MKTQFQIAEKMLQFSRMTHIVNFKVAASVGKVTGIQGKLNKIMNDSFQGLSLDEYMGGINLDSYDSDIVTSLMLNDLEQMADVFGTMTKDLNNKLKAKVKQIKLQPRPGSIDDGNSNHKYFYDRNLKRWWWVDKSNMRGAKNYAPFDYEAGTGMYIRYDQKTDKWFSYAPLYNGKEVEIFPDTVEE